MFKLLFPLFVALLAFNLSSHAEPLKIGDSIPDSSLKTESGEAVQLRELVAKKPTVLIFYRGGWCPYCNRQLAALVDIEKDLIAAGYQLLAISADQPSKLAETPKRESLGYTLLSDNTMAAAKAFGITFVVPQELHEKYKKEYSIDIEAASGLTHHTLPHPAVYVVGIDGVIDFVHVDEDYKVRLDPAKILKAAQDASTQ